MNTPIWQALQTLAKHSVQGLNLARTLRDAQRFEAEVTGLAHRRDALYGGAVVNTTEQRPALHVHLRAWGAIAQEAEDGCCAGLRERARFTDVLHISIGGSGLGPELVLQAQQPWCVGGRHVHVVSNMDGHDLLSKSWFTAGLLSACMLDAASEANSCAAYSEAI